MGTQNGPEEAEGSRVMGPAPSGGGRGVSSTWKFPALTPTVKPPGEDPGQGVIQSPSPPLCPPMPTGGRHTWTWRPLLPLGRGP